MFEQTESAVLEQRLNELKAIGENPEERSEHELMELVEEREQIEAVLEERKAKAEAEAEERAKIAAQSIEPVKTFEEERKTMEYSVNSAEYRSGFLKELLNQELTAEERQAVDYVATTGDTTYNAGKLVPTTMLNEIWSLIEEQHPILGDITLYRTNTILAVNVLSAISQGDAKSVNENAANDDEINTYVQITLNGKDFSKHVNISYAMEKMAIDAFEAYLSKEIADRIGAALAADVVAQIKSDYDDTNNAIVTAAEGKIAWGDVTAAFAVLKNKKGNVKVYLTNATLYGKLAAMADTTGRPIFQPSAQAGVAGYLLGAEVKVEDACTDDEIIIGYPQQVIGNMVQDIMVESQKDIKKHVVTYAGYARFECKLAAAKAFATLTVDAGE